MAEHREYVETAVGEITRRGPLGPSDMPDRSHTSLRVLGAYLEPWADADAVAPALAGELQSLAGWLKFHTVRAGCRGNLAGPLSSALRL